LYPAFALELREASGIDIGLARSGLLELALTEAEEQSLAARAAWQTERGLRAELLAGPELREREPCLGPAVRRGLLLPDEGHVNARALARALSQAAAI